MHLCILTYVWMHAFVMCICISLCIYVNVCMYLCIYVCVCMYMYMYVYMYIYIYMCVYVCMYRYIDLLYSISWLFILLCLTIIQFVDAEQQVEMFTLNWRKRTFCPSVRTHSYICIFLYIFIFNCEMMSGCATFASFCDSYPITENCFVIFHIN